MPSISAPRREARLIVLAREKLRRDNENAFASAAGFGCESRKGREVAGAVSTRAVLNDDRERCAGCGARNIAVAVYRHAVRTAGPENVRNCSLSGTFGARAVVDEQETTRDTRQAMAWP